MGMKRSLLVSLLVMGMLCMLSGVAVAQVRETDLSTERFEEGEILTWLRSNPPDWSKGGILAGLGLVGALVTLFGLIGGVVPGTAGQARIDADSKRLEVMSTRLDELIANSASSPATIEAVKSAVNELRDDLRSEKWSQFAIAAFLYAILGASLAAILSDTFLQAIVIGAGWTGLVGSLGLKKDHAARDAIKDEALQKAEQVVGTMQQGGGGATSASLQELDKTLQVARAV